LLSLETQLYQKYQLVILHFLKYAFHIILSPG